MKCATALRQRAGGPEGPGPWDGAVVNRRRQNVPREGLRREKTIAIGFRLFLAGLVILHALSYFGSIDNDPPPEKRDVVARLDLVVSLIRSAEACRRSYTAAGDFTFLDTAQQLSPAVDERLRS